MSKVPSCVECAFRGVEKWYGYERAAPIELQSIFHAISLQTNGLIPALYLLSILLLPSSR